MAGRPRSAEADAAILDAAISLLCEGSFDQFSMDGVAAAAGLTRPTVYLRYPNKSALVRAAVNHVVENHVPEETLTENPRENVQILLEATIRMLTRTPVGRMFRNVIPHLDSEPELAWLANETGRKRRIRLRRAFEALVDAGELGAERDIDLLIDGILGAIYFRFLITGRSLNRTYLRNLLNESLG